MATDKFPRSIHSDAKDDLRELAKWLQGAEMIQVDDHTWRCVDSGQMDRLRPLLKKLNLYEHVSRIPFIKYDATDETQDFMATLSRRAGRTEIVKTHGYNNLVFPLSGPATICGHNIEPGMYIFLTRDGVVDGNLDILVVSVPVNQRRFG